METHQLRRLALERMAKEGTPKLRLAQTLDMNRESLVRVLNGRSAGTLETWDRILNALNLELQVKDRKTGEVLEVIEPPLETLNQDKTPFDAKGFLENARDKKPVTLGLPQGERVPEGGWSLEDQLEEMRQDRDL